MKKKNSSLRRFFVTLQFALLICLSFSTVRAAGEVDPTFSPALIKTASTRAAVTAVQPDGKIITYGIFTAVSGVPVPTNLVRLNADGTLDTSFNAQPIAGVAAVSEIGLQPDGKIVITGNFIAGPGQQFIGMLRLNTDGSYDTTFTARSDSTQGAVLDFEILPDGKFVIGTPSGLRRLLPDGSLDPTFNTGGSISSSKIALQPDGKIVNAGSDGKVNRNNPDGTVDLTFTQAVFNSTVWDIKIQPDGKILVGGQFTTLNGFARPKLARLNADGTVDATFNAPLGNGGLVLKVIPLPDGKILVGGKGLAFSGQPLRLNSDGSIDQTFTSTIQISVYDLDLLPDGKIIVSGESAFSNSTVKAMYRLNPDGTADLSFQANFGNGGEGRKIFVQPDGKILVGGNFDYANNFSRPSITRFNADGSVDTSFNLNFFYTSTDTYDAIDVQPDGKIIIGSIFGNSDSRRLNPDGSPDILFPLAKNAKDVKVLSSGKILFAGSNYVKRYNSDGNVDSSFAVDVSSGSVNKLAVQPDGKIIIVGDFIAVNSVTRGRIARLNADGTLDTTFDTSTGANGSVTEAAVQSNGQILIGGTFTGVNFANRQFLARLNSNGSLDTTFVPNLNGSVESIKIQPNGKILIGGAFTTVNSASRNRIARLNQDGTLDSTFNPGSGADATVFDVELQNNGKVLIAGQFRLVNGALRYGVARLENSLVARTLFDYDGDGRADLSVFRPSENKWYVLRSSDSQVTQQIFAINGDVPVPADYDGDGKTDFAIFRPSSGDWWYLSSVNGSQNFAHWGANGDIPRPSDFDGDGKTDFVVFRPSNNFWYRISNTIGGASSNSAFGLSGDKPVTGDFDGDGKSDLAIYRPSTGDWWWKSSINGAQLATHWGISTDVPAPADYDGDGKTDFAVYRPSTGVWYIINSSNGSFTIFQFGISEDKPVPADYDGDGKADIAVFRPSSGTWYQQKSSNGFAAQQFGVSTDIPTENAFVP